MTSENSGSAAAVKNPSIEFLLKQVYAAHKEELKILSDKLKKEQTRKLINSPCHFCGTLKKQVENLRLQLDQLIKEQCQRSPKTSTDVSTQTDVPALLENTGKRTIKFSPPRKRPHHQVQKSPSKDDDNDVVLAPGTPDKNPLREARVKRWFETMEIPETVDPYMHQDLVCHSSSLASNKTIDLPSVTEVDDLDATYLPLSDQKRTPFEEEDGEMNIENGQVHDSTASSECLLDMAVVVRNSEKAIGRVLADVANIGHKNTKETEKKLQFKYKEEPVRKKKDRMRLPAHQCVDCAKYYEGADGIKQRDLCSKHRANNVAPATPEHFWELDFPDTQVSKERGYVDTTQIVTLPSRRRKFFKQEPS